ncbi:MAG: ABC transporter substrate-binding protein [Candidatus Sungbacteria bacterium]|nr:ABC transporter substrate-binding protein [Candidatus Sungbacteria bacterium]
MTKMRRLGSYVLFTLIMTLLSVGPGFSATADQEIMLTIASLKSIFDNKALSQEEQMKQAREIVLERLDLTRTSSAILVRHIAEYRHRLNEFTDVFGKLIRRSYLSRVDKVQKMKNASVLSSELYGDTAEVTLSFTLDGDRYEVIFSMHMSNGRWKIYNLSVGGVGLVGNYRAQVDRMLRTMSFDELLKEFEKKAAGL